MTGRDIAWRVALSLESAVLLAPVAVVTLVGGRVAVAGVLPLWPAEDHGPLAWRWQLFGLYLLTCALATIAMLEVVRVLLATMSGRYLGWRRRTTFAALSGVVAVVAGAVGLSAVGSNQPPPLLFSLSVLVGPVGLLCVQLGWLQVRLGRAVAAP
jgi:hypothetical protein